MSGRLQLVLLMALFVAFASAAEDRLPSSWNRCSCSVAPAIKTATDSCSSSSKKNDELRDCILKNVGVFDGTNLDTAAAEKLIDKFNATSQQKESLKKSWQSCEPQSRHDAGKLRTCSADVLRRRCLTDPKTVCNKRDE